MFEYLKTNQTNRAFSLIELLVAMFMFSLIITTVSAIFISDMRSQTRALATQRILDQTSYAVEFMSRALRMAAKELSVPSTCLSYGENYEVGSGGTSLKFINHLENDDCQRFFLDSSSGSGQLKYEKDSDGTPVIYDLTSNKLDITSLKFQLAGGTQGDDLQPRVTFSAEIKWKSPMVVGLPKMRIQTTISQRNLDIFY